METLWCPHFWVFTSPGPLTVRIYATPLKPTVLNLKKGSEVDSNWRSSKVSVPRINLVVRRRRLERVLPMEVQSCTQKTFPMNKLEFCILSERKAYRLPDRPFGDRNARRNSGASRQVDHVII